MMRTAIAAALALPLSVALGTARAQSPAGSALPAGGQATERPPDPNQPREDLLDCRPVSVWEGVYDAAEGVRRVGGEVQGHGDRGEVVLIDFARRGDLRPLYGVECQGRGSFDVAIPKGLGPVVPVVHLDLNNDGPTSDDPQAAGSPLAEEGDVDGLVFVLEEEVALPGYQPDAPVLPEPVPEEPPPEDGGPPPMEGDPPPGGAPWAPADSGLWWLLPALVFLAGALATGLPLGLWARRRLRPLRALQPVGAAGTGPQGLPPVLGKTQVWTVPSADAVSPAALLLAHQLVGHAAVVVVPDPSRRALWSTRMAGRAAVTWLPTDRPMGADITAAARVLTGSGPVVIVVDGVGALEEPLKSETADTVIQELIRDAGDDLSVLVIAAQGAVQDAAVALQPVPGGLGTADGVVVPL